MKLKIIFIILAFFTFFSCTSSTGPNGETSSTGPPKPGQWSASAGFGSFDFVVNSGSIYITSITYHFSKWSCGAYSTLSGNITISSNPGWAISGRSFEIENYVDYHKDEKLKISGTFSESGDQASGSWEGERYGSTCSGSWQGSPTR